MSIVAAALQSAVESGSDGQTGKEAGKFGFSISSVRYVGKQGCVCAARMCRHVLTSSAGESLECEKRTCCREQQAELGQKERSRRSKGDHGS